MNTGVAQLVALAAHGNAALQQLVSPEGLDESPLFRHVSTLAFALEPDQLKPACSRVSEWFESFRARDITRVRFIRLSNNEESLDAPNRTAFANGEQSALAAIHHSGSMEIWVPDWQAVEGQEGWTLTYRGFSGGPWSDQWNGAPVRTAAQRLETTLEEIAEFARGQDLERWADSFDSAREVLTGSEVPEAMGLLPNVGYSAEARRLLAGALASWVFGGMGSWNDTGPRDADQYPRYEALSGQLYDALMDGLVSSANAFDPALR